MSELLPCPFCGDVAAIKVSDGEPGEDDLHKAFCVRGYCAESPWHTVKADSIRWWNGHREALQQEADKDGELTKIGMLIRPRSGLINFVQQIDALPLEVHETMEVFAALPLTAIKGEQE